jgi:hypothetical protein
MRELNLVWGRGCVTRHRLADEESMWGIWPTNPFYWSDLPTNTSFMIHDPVDELIAERGIIRASEGRTLQAASEIS